MRVSVDGVKRRGSAIDLRDLDVPPQAVLGAVRDSADDRVVAATPRPPTRGHDTTPALHERVGFVRRGMAVSTIPAVAAAARSRGATTEHDAELRQIATEVASIDVPDVDLAAARQRVADTAADVERLREAVARASGRVEARQMDDEDVDRDASSVNGNASSVDADAALQSATRELAERETEYHAAKEALSAARRRAREARDARERRLELEDRCGNLRRAAHRTLADAAADSFRRAIAALPVPAEPVHPSEFAGPDWAGACAVARIADVAAPLVVAHPFERATRARVALDAPVLLVEV